MSIQDRISAPHLVTNMVLLLEIKPSYLSFDQQEQKHKVRNLYHYCT